MAKPGEKRTRILLGVAVALVVIIFALVFFEFPDNTHAKFTFSAPDENGCVKVTGYTGNPTTLNIPSTDQDGHKVIAIAEGSFGSTYSRLEKVKIPNTVTVIEKDAFFGAPNLEEVKLSSKLIEIGDGAFAECTQLEEIEFPETLERIGARAFYRCINLETLYIPASVSDFGEEAFVSCENLVLDVSDNVLAADEAAKYNLETGTVDTTAIYLIVILSITVVGTVLIVFVWHHVRHKAEKKNKAE